MVFGKGQLQQFLTGIAMIIIFISLKASPLDKYFTPYYMWWLIGAVLLFIYSPSIASKIGGE